ncbi:MAG: hypothetical protein DSY90_12175 [Deltaproteobacteria bacterium]|nr:MAG: hypothetical protein DSY90_12175 [Deltaproteobacteria bacterium]
MVPGAYARRVGVEIEVTSIDKEREMPPEKTEKKPKRLFNVFFRIGVCLGVLLLGVFGMSKLASFKKPPAEAKTEIHRLRVDTVVVKPQAVPVFISGYGQARPLNVVALAPEVSGRVTAVHPRLETGEVIAAGDVLFEVDPINYQVALKQTRAAVARWQSTIARLKKQSVIDKERLKTLRRNKDLAQAEFKRIRTLFESDSVGTRSGVERAEQAFNAATDHADQMAQAVALYPIRIKEAQSSLASARAGNSLSKVNLARCRVTAPFTGRIKSVNIEKGQFAVPGQPVLTLADDSVLEIRVPLDSRDARKWLDFDDTRTHVDTAWFSRLKQQPCTVLWTEDKKGHHWQGKLHRVVKFDPQTRTVTVAIRVDARSAASTSSGTLPLVEGMFCEVRIPGRPLENVYRLPRQAVSFENTVYLSVNDRLRTRPVEVARVEGESVYVSGGLKPGDRVITTRLIDPLENTLLKIDD